MVFTEAINGSYSFTFDKDEIKLKMLMVSPVGEFIVAKLASNDSCHEMWSAMLSSLTNALFNKIYETLSQKVID